MNTAVDYAPTCTLAALQARAMLYRTIRQFFFERGVLEVETPILSSAGATDVHLSSIAATRKLNGQTQIHYLQTSPEFAMKRLLACGSGAIYQICKVFRDGEHGTRHNSEFSMLEWYRPHFSLDELMSEVVDLLKACLGGDLAIVRQSYKQAFIAHLGINPLQADVDTLKQKAATLGLGLDLGDERLAYMDLLFSHVVEPNLGKDCPLFLYDFPPELAALAKVHCDTDGEWVASRFELYIDGLELANAYDELADENQLRQRFLCDNNQRQRLGLPIMPIDERLLLALPKMPPCSGIALGLDRLLMVITQAKSLSAVVSFTASCA